MQLQQSVFSLHNFIVRKPPVCLWIVFLAITSLILMLETVHYANEPIPYQFSECFYQYYQMTRQHQQQTNQTSIQQDKNNSGAKENSYVIDGNNQHSNSSTKNSKQSIANQTKTNTSQQKNEKNEDIRLIPQYYNLFNQTTIVKIFVSEDVKYVGNTAQSCRIILNIPVEENSPNNSLAINGSNNRTKLENPDSVYFDDKNHPKMHLAKNQHLISLDFNTRQFKQRHKIVEHVIILSKQSSYQQAYPTFFGISSKYWRFHTKEELTSNQNLIQGIGKSLKQLQEKVKIQYQAYIQKKLNEIQETSNKNDSTKSVKKQKESNKTIIVVAQQDKNNYNDINDIQRKTNNLQIQTKQKPSQKDKHEGQEITVDKFLLSVLLMNPQLTQISVVEQLILYYHFEGLTYQQRVSTINHSLEPMSFIVKIVMLCIITAPVIALSVMLGLFVRYLFISLLTGYLFLGGCWINQQWGWVYQYFNIIRRRVRQDQNASLLSSLKMSIHLTIAMIATYLIMTLGVKHIIDTIWIHSLVFSDIYYSQMFIKNMFLVELFYFVSCRSRTSIRFYPIFSLLITILIVFTNSKCFFCNTSWLINLHMWVHLLLFFGFAVIENLVGNFQADEQYRPTFQKPRALYYAGYDISWQNSLPPVWTYFTRWFDLGHFGKSQKSLINKDYRLLYGRMLGMSQQQQLPEQAQFQMQEEPVHKQNQNLSQNNNESGLLR